MRTKRRLSLDARISFPAMKLPIIKGIIHRRILANFRVDSDVMRRHLPPGFEPKLHAGSAIAGICLIRLEQIRPKLAPAFLGVSSENAAHRIAVRWTDSDGAEHEGVFIPRRDTGSWLNHLAGGRLFPGEHHLADFVVKGDDDSVDLEMKSRDGKVAVKVKGRSASVLPSASGFGSLAEASAFFESGSLGYSVTRGSNRLDGISLRTRAWKVEALDLTEIHSSYFADATLFPKGSVQFDCALLMRNIPHEWHAVPDFALGEPCCKTGNTQEVET